MKSGKYQKKIPRFLLFTFFVFIWLFGTMVVGTRDGVNFYYTVFLPIAMAWMATIFLSQLLDYLREDAGSEDNEPEAGVNE